MPATYFVDYPRDFCNEYNVYVVSRADHADFVRFIPSARRISRAEAIKLGWTRPKQAKRDGEYWLGGFYDDPLSRFADTLAEALDECRKATERLVAEREQGAEIREEEMRAYENGIL